MLDEFERSGLKGTQFARLLGIKYQTFASWVQKRRHERGEYAFGGPGAALSQTQSVSLVEAVMSSHAVDHHQDKASGLQLRLPGGAEALISTPPQARLAAELIQALRISC